MSPQQSLLSPLWWSHWQEATSYLQTERDRNKSLFYLLRYEANEKFSSVIFRRLQERPPVWQEAKFSGVNKWLSRMHYVRWNRWVQKHKTIPQRVNVVVPKAQQTLQYISCDRINAACEIKSLSPFMTLKLRSERLKLSSESLNSVWMCGSTVVIAMLVSWPTTLRMNPVLSWSSDFMLAPLWCWRLWWSVMSQQLLDRLPCNLVHTSAPPSGWNVIALLILWLAVLVVPAKLPISLSCTLCLVTLGKS